jgi:hypothetical protein
LVPKNYESGGQEFESLRARQKSNKHQLNLNAGKDGKRACDATSQALKLATNAASMSGLEGGESKKAVIFHFPSPATCEAIPASTRAAFPRGAIAWHPPLLSSDATPDRRERETAGHEAEALET